MGDPAFGRAIDAARHGTPLGFEWLWHRFSRQVVSFLRLQGSEDPEGLTNLVFVAVFGKIGDFHGDERNFVSLLFAVARNKLIDERRARGRRVSTSELTTDPGVAGGNVEDEALGILSPQAQQALAVLTDEQREVLLLRLVADLPIEEVAVLTGRTPGAVKSMQHRALETIRREISSEAVSP